jgi:hypothetical protein
VLTVNVRALFGVTPSVPRFPIFVIQDLKAMSIVDPRCIAKLVKYFFDKHLMELVIGRVYSMDSSEELC